jgi:hypothetical protein
MPSRQELERHGGVAADLKKRLLEHIAEEVAFAKAGQAGRHLAASATRSSTPEIIDALYDASQAGVQIDLVVRGICCLQARASRACRTTSASSRSSGASSSIPASTPSAAATACPAPRPRLYISSADLMPRNLDRRVEALCRSSTRRSTSSCSTRSCWRTFKDNDQSWRSCPTGPAERIVPGKDEETFNAHKYFMTNPSLSGRGKSLKSSSPRSLRRRAGRGASEAIVTAGSAPAIRDRSGMPQQPGPTRRRTDRHHRYRVQLRPPRGLRGLTRAPTPIFNEKVAGGPRPGGAVDSGRLADDAMAQGPCRAPPLPGAVPGRWASRRHPRACHRRCTRREQRPGLPRRMRGVSGVPAAPAVREATKRSCRRSASCPASGSPTASSAISAAARWS